MAPLVGAFLLLPHPAQADTTAKDARIHRIYPFCNTWSCVKRVHRIRARREWRYYKRHPLPWCTWGPESGGNYRARNPSSTAGGKFQIINTTWWAYGGSRYRDSHPAAVAPRLEQERIARRVLRGQGIHAWVNC